MRPKDTPTMACSSAVERLTVNQVVAGSIPAGPVPSSMRCLLDEGEVGLCPDAIWQFA